MALTTLSRHLTFSRLAVGRIAHRYHNVTMAADSSVSTDALGYPDRTFNTEILPCEPDARITFQEASLSAQSAATEPFHKAQPNIASKITESSLKLASSHLAAGHVVAFPTETVYGLAASALNQPAALKIYAAKKRPADNPLIVHVSDLDMLHRLLPDDYRPSPVYQALMNNFWPGSLTLLFPVSRNNPAVPSVVTCGQPSVAIRMPSHPIARSLIALSGLPLAAPSANASGRPSPTTAAHVMRDLGGQLDAETGTSSQTGPLGRLKYIIDGGPSDVGLESTVVDGISSPGELRVLRPGGVTVEQISSVLASQGLLKSDEGANAPKAVQLRVYGKDLVMSAEQVSNPTTPGMKYRHYSPTARVAMLFPSRVLAATLGAQRSKAEDLLHGHAGEDKAKGSSSPTQNLSDIVAKQLEMVPKTKNADGIARIGFMMSNDSSLAAWVQNSAEEITTSATSRHACLLAPLRLRNLPNVEVHRFDLGPTSRADIYAQRMFDGLRTLDEGPLIGGGKCDLIFVEALIDDDVGLAVMNRLKKAASETILVDC